MRRYFVAALLLTSLATVARAQVSKLVETIEVRVTNVDVVVLDKNGNPVHNLTKDDFEVYENGKKQPLTNFYEVRADAPASAAAAGNAEAVNDVPPEIRQRRIIFFVDNYSLHPFRRNEVFSAVEKYIGTLFQPGDQAMLVTWNRSLKIVVPFTNDRQRLLDGLHKTERVSGGGVSLAGDRDRLKDEVDQVLEMARAASSGRRSNDRQSQANDAYQQALSMTRAYADGVQQAELSLARAMSTMLTTLAGLEGKKVMVFAGAQLPDKPGLEMFHWLETKFSGDMSVAPAAFREANRDSVSAELEKVAKQANANGVTIYMIDGADPTRGSNSDPSSVEMLDPTMEFLDFTNTANAFGTMARMTGGIALMRTNNFDLALNTVARDLGSYYSLGYKPADDTTPGDRKIVVKTKNREYSVRARQTYVVKTAEEQTNDRVISNAFHAQLKGDIPVTLFTSQPVKMSHSRYKVPVRISFPSSLTLLPNGENLEGQFSVLFAVVDDNGALSPVSRRSQAVKLPKSAEPALRAKPISFTAEIVVTPGEHYVSVGIVDDVSGSAGYARTRIATR
jgi:VWFA-related protein